MTRNVAVLAWDLAVAVISILFFFATPVWLATREINQLRAIFLLIGSAMAATFAAFRFRQDLEPWPIQIFAPVDLPAQDTVRPSMTDWLRSLDWARRAQRS